MDGNLNDMVGFKDPVTTGVSDPDLNTELDGTIELPDTALVMTDDEVDQEKSDVVEMLTALEDLNEFHNRMMSAKGINRTYAEEGQALFKEFDGGRGLSHYSANVSKVRYEAAMESLIDRCKDIIQKIIAKIVAYWKIAKNQVKNFFAKLNDTKFDAFDKVYQNFRKTTIGVNGALELFLVKGRGLNLPNNLQSVCNLNAGEYPELYLKYPHAYLLQVKQGKNATFVTAESMISNADKITDGIGKISESIKGGHGIPVNMPDLTQIYTFSDGDKFKGDDIVAHFSKLFASIQTGFDNDNIENEIADPLKLIESLDDQYPARELIKLVDKYNNLWSSIDGFIDQLDKYEDTIEDTTAAQVIGASLVVVQDLVVTQAMIMKTFLNYILNTYASTVKQTITFYKTVKTIINASAQPEKDSMVKVIDKAISDMQKDGTTIINLFVR